LLPDVRETAPDFVDQLCAYSMQASKRPQPDTQTLIEPLSDRELEVMGLIAAGLANREIADELVIALGTVKRHINHIYGKMGVARRTQAIARARELELI
jgi:LuxR family maltose regulon positive regulatory protein